MSRIAAATRHPRRYLAIGLLCAGIHNAVMLAVDAIGIHYMLGLVISFALLAPTAYALHSFYTFNRAMGRDRFVRFAGGMLAGFPMNFGLMIVLVSGLELAVPLATLIATILMFAWNYLAARWAILLHRPRCNQPG
jgi:putative flippase GtrA